MPRSLLSLADLLTVLERLEASEYPAVAKAFGLAFVPEPANAPPPSARKPSEGPPEPADARPAALPKTELAPPEASPSFWRLASRWTVPDEKPDVPAWLQGQPLGDPRFHLPDDDARAPAASPLVSRARFARFMRDHLCVQRRTGELDAQRLTQRLARRQALTRLPAQRRVRWPAQVRVVVDGAPVLRPFQHDVATLLAQMRRQLGQRLQVLSVDGEPWVGQDDAVAALPADATPTLVFSDAGATAGQAAVIQRWGAAARRMQRAGRAPVLLSPVPLDAAAISGAAWQAQQFAGRGALKPSFKAGGTPPAMAGASDAAIASQASSMPPLAPSAARLRATLWGNSYVTPALLRSLRRMLLRHGLGGGLGDELAVWRDEALQSNAHACAVAAVYREAVREEFLQLPDEVQADTIALHLDHLAAQSPLVRAEYARHLSRAWQGSGPVADRLSAERDAADTLAAQAAAWLWRGDQGVAHELAAYLARMGHRSGELLGADDPLLAAWALAQRQALRAGELDLPQGVDAQHIKWVIPPDDELPTHRLRVVGAAGAAGLPGSRLVFEPAPDQGPQGLELVDKVPAGPYLRLAPMVDDQPWQVLRNLVGWWRRALQDQAFEPKRLNMGDAWARPLLSELQRLTGDNERATLEWLAYCRASEGSMRSPSPLTPGDTWRQMVRLASLLWRQLPAEWLRSQGLQLPDERADRQFLRPAHSARLDPAWHYSAQVGNQRFELEAFQRPAWAEEIKREDGQAWAKTQEGRWLRWMPRQAWNVLQPADGNAQYLLPAGFWWDEEEAQNVYFAPGMQLVRPQWAARHGVDEHGYWAEFDLPPHPEDRAGLSPLEVMFDVRITQRMRFIPPGRFWMGSPQAEDGRSDSEILHPVTLTRGHWLADTACPQGLWRAVLGNLPVGQPERGDDLPVVNVSHDDILQQFLPALARLVPGLNPRLPSEAEWEYAARAGTVTAYPWGDAPDPGQMNFVGFEKQSAGRPVPVRQFSANAWGFWQMHGNVWEWCSDARVDYPLDEVLDPRTETGAGRVLRGGSWVSDARGCRSALRGAGVPGKRSAIIGFRLARGLPEARRAEPGEGRGAPELPAQPAQDGGPGAGGSGALDRPGARRSRRG